MSEKVKSALLNANLGKVISEETKIKMSVSHLDRINNFTPEEKDARYGNHGNNLKNRTPEAMKKMRDKKLTYCPIEIGLKISKANKGKKVSEETKRKISSKLKGVPRSPDTIAKIQETKKIKKELKLLQNSLA